MLNNYLKIVFRSIKKNKIYSIINIIGLAVGFTVVFLIYLYIQHELSYDKYHIHDDRIFRVAQKSTTATSEEGSAKVCAASAQVLKDHFPQIEKVARLLPVNNIIVRRGNKSFYENHRMYADTELFSILTIPFLKGDPKTALDRPATIVISQRMAFKYFGDEDPLGKTLQINSRDYEVTGVVQDAPVNTHLKYDFFASLKTLEGLYPFSAWFFSNFYVYIKLQPGTDVALLSKQLAHLAEIYASEEVAELNETVAHFIQPVRDIHLYSHLRSEPEPGTNPLYLYIFSVIGIFILSIACFNFINLSTARSMERTKEVGMRKVVGAQRKQLILQFLGESIIIVFIAFLLALFSIDSTSNLLGNVIGIGFRAGTFFQLKMLGKLFLFVLFIGVVAGMYPAFSLSAFRPIHLLKSTKSKVAGRTNLRKILVVSQFVISVILVIATLTIYRQIHFMKTAYPGFNRDQKLIIPVRGSLSLTDNYELIKNELLKHTFISGATVSYLIPGEMGDRWATKLVGAGDEQYHDLNYNYVDPDFISEYGLKICAGRSFQKELSTDIDRSWIINMTTLREFGWSSPEEALGRWLTIDSREGEIIGVIADYHYQGLQQLIEPLVLSWRPNRFQNITLTVDTKNLKEVIPFIKKTWSEIFSGAPFEYYFLDDVFNQQYHSEERIGRMVNAFTVLAFIIACLGLFGLASITVEQRTKEIGIRKVLGATIPGILILLSKNYTRWILVANSIAWPVAYVVVRKWLQYFPYRIEVEWWVFLSAGILALVIALATVSYQVVMAATSNPVEALRYE